MVSPYEQRFGLAGRLDWLDAHQGLLGLGGVGGQYTVSETYFGASVAAYARVYNPRAFVCTHGYVFNGAVVSGNFDIGIYNELGTKIIAAGATAQSGTSQIQWVPLAATIPAGWLILAFVADNITATFATPNTNIAHYPQGMIEMLGWARETAAYPLPAALTPVAFGAITELPPLFGVVRRWP